MKNQLIIKKEDIKNSLITKKMIKNKIDKKANKLLNRINRAIERINDAANNPKLLSILLITFYMSIIFQIPLISALNLENFIYGFSPGNEFFYVQIAIFLLIFAIVFAVLNKTRALGENRGILAVVSLTISLIATYYMSQKQVFAIILTYKSLGLLLMLLIPIIILVFISIQLKVPLFRKSLWFLYLVFLVYMYYTNEQVDKNLLLGFMIFSLIMILLDKPIHDLTRKYLEKRKRG